MNDGYIILSELLGTMFLVLIGCGTNAAVNLKKTYAYNSGWLIICAGWAIGILVGINVATYSGGHINPAVSFAQWIVGAITFTEWIMYLIGQMAGAMIGALIVAFIFWDHFKATDNKAAISGTFYTGPALSTNYLANLFVEIVGTFILIFAILMFVPTSGTSGSFFIAAVVFGIGVSFGSLTGFAINPARDLGPRIVHQFSRIPNKGTTNWKYSWVPVVGPFVAAVLAAGIYLALPSAIAASAPISSSFNAISAQFSLLTF